MKKLLSTSLLLFSMTHVSVSSASDGWMDLLDKDLTQWNTYLGFPLPETPIADVPKDAEGNYVRPLGHGRNDRDVFSVSIVDGEPVLRISGEIYGSVYTRESFENYQLSLEFKWGSQKWKPRLDLELDSGILYHAIGEHGVDYWKAWAMSQEFQIIEGGNGDWWQIAGSQIDIRCEKPEGAKDYIYNPEAPFISFGPGGAGIHCRSSHNAEKPMGEWNRLDLITYGDESLHIVNGELVMALKNSRYTLADSTVMPLTKGQILLQSEAGEVFFRRIKIKSIEGIPEKYNSHFSAP